MNVSFQRLLPENGPLANGPKRTLACRVQVPVGATYRAQVLRYQRLNSGDSEAPSVTEAVHPQPEPLPDEAAGRDLLNARHDPTPMENHRIE